MEKTTSLAWTSIWGNAMSITENKPEAYAKDITLRYPVRIPFSVKALRITFDNYCGTEAITISKATVYDGMQFYPLTFGGSEAITISAGCDIVSDSVSCALEADSTVYISFYLGEFTQMRSGVYVSGPLSSGQYGIGDLTTVADFPIDISRKTNIFYFLSNISAYASSDNGCVICYGDSITAQDWPDYLSLICKEHNIDNTAIIRRATSGSRILREYSCITYESYGLMGSKRFDHEIPTDGAHTIIIQQGINDIIHPVGIEVNPFRPMSDLPTADELIEGLKMYITKARALGLKIYVGTLLPIEGWRTYAPFRDELRNAYNDWIRNTDLIDGCIDFDKAVRNPEHPCAFLPEYDSGDHLHPSAAGYRAMADEAFKIVKNL